VFESPEWLVAPLMFYPTYGSDAEGQRRAYSLAMFAMASGKRVTIQNDDQYGNDCTTSVFLQVHAD
jgi:hypothetical protein